MEFQVNKSDSCGHEAHADSIAACGTLKANWLVSWQYKLNRWIEQLVIQYTYYLVNPNIFMK